MNQPNTSHLATAQAATNAILSAAARWGLPTEPALAGVRTMRIVRSWPVRDQLATIAWGSEPVLSVEGVSTEMLVADWRARAPRRVRGIYEGIADPSCAYVARSIADAFGKSLPIPFSALRSLVALCPMWWRRKMCERGAIVVSGDLFAHHDPMVCAAMLAEVMATPPGLLTIAQWSPEARATVTRWAMAVLNGTNPQRPEWVACTMITCIAEYKGDMLVVVPDATTLLSLMARAMTSTPTIAEIVGWSDHGAIDAFRWLQRWGVFPSGTAASWLVDEPHIMREWRHRAGLYLNVYRLGAEAMPMPETVLDALCQNIVTPSRKFDVTEWDEQVQRDVFAWLQERPRMSGSGHSSWVTMAPDALGNLGANSLIPTAEQLNAELVLLLSERCDFSVPSWGPAQRFEAMAWLQAVSMGHRENEPAHVSRWRFSTGMFFDGEHRARCEGTVQMLRNAFCDDGAPISSVPALEDVLEWSHEDREEVLAWTGGATVPPILAPYMSSSVPTTPPAGPGPIEDAITLYIAEHGWPSRDRAETYLATFLRSLHHLAAEAQPGQVDSQDGPSAAPVPSGAGEGSSEIHFGHASAGGAPGVPHPDQVAEHGLVQITFGDRTMRGTVSRWSAGTDYPHNVTITLSHADAARLAADSLAGRDRQISIDGVLVGHGRATHASPDADGMDVKIELTSRPTETEENANDARALFTRIESTLVGSLVGSTGPTTHDLAVAMLAEHVAQEAKRAGVDPAKSRALMRSARALSDLDIIEEVYGTILVEKLADFYRATFAPEAEDLLSPTDGVDSIDEASVVTGWRTGSRTSPTWR